MLLEDHVEADFSIGQMFGEPGKPFYADNQMTNIHLVRLGKAEHPDLHDPYLYQLLAESPELALQHGPAGAPAGAVSVPSPTAVPPPAAALPPAAVDFNQHE